MLHRTTLLPDFSDTNQKSVLFFVSGQNILNIQLPCQQLVIFKIECQKPDYHTENSRLVLSKTIQYFVALIIVSLHPVATLLVQLLCRKQDALVTVMHINETAITQLVVPSIEYDLTLEALLRHGMGGSKITVQSNYKKRVPC